MTSPDPPVFNAIDGPPNPAIATTTSADSTARLWEIFASTQELVSHAKVVAPRCLTTAQRNLSGLRPEPPPWCIELEKWPYHTHAWKQWLSDHRADKSTPLPTTP